MLEPPDFRALFDALPTPYVVLTRHLVIAGANAGYLSQTARTLEELLGQGLFEAFPPSPDTLDDRGVPRVQTMLEQVRDTGRVVAMPVEKYDIVDDDGTWAERFWLLVGAPVLDGGGRTTHLLMRAEDVTAFGQGRAAAQDLARVEAVEADLFARAQELAVALEARDVVARRLARLHEITLELAAAETLAELERIVVGRGLAEMGADGGAVGVLDAEGGLSLTMTDQLEGQLQHGHLPADSVLPAAFAARNGQRVLLPTAAAARAFDPEMEQLQARTGLTAWAVLPLRVRSELIGSLSACWVGEHDLTLDELQLFETLAAQCAQAVHRIRTGEQTRAAARQLRRLAESLQQSLLTPPPTPPHLDLAVRYLPAAQRARVGGDWYDAFVQPDGTTMLVVGDVVGHDRTAAAQMGQLRGLLRALSYTQDPGQGRCPLADVLTRVEHTAQGLAVNTLASVVLARVEGAGTAHCTLRWSNAGHLPPVRLDEDGTVTVLASPPDLLLGVDADTDRADQLTPLPVGSTVLLFTDGLIERRGISLDDGLAQLEQALQGLGQVPLDRLCDTVLARLAPEPGEDDIALLAARNRL